MTFSSVDAVMLTIAVLVPGFVWEGVMQALLPRRESRADRAAIRILTLSAFNYGFWSWLVYLLVRFELLDRPWMAALAWFFILFIAPATLGALTGLLGQRAIVRRFLAAFGVQTIHPVPTAWDYVFSHARPKGFWVLATLVNGSTVAGVFGDRSFASSDPAERDLHLERLYSIEDDGTWQPAPMNGGVWIHGKAIHTIETMAFQG